MQKPQATTYEFTTDPALPASTESTIRVNTVDHEFGMVRLEDWLPSGEGVLLRFDYTDHLHITHSVCGGEMRLRKKRGSPWLEVACCCCRGGFVPYRQVSSQLDDSETKVSTLPSPLHLRNDAVTFRPLLHLLGNDRVIRATHPVTTVEDDRFVASDRAGKVLIKLDLHQQISFVHEPCGRAMNLRVTHRQDVYQKDFVELKCCCRAMKTWHWLRKVVTTLPSSREWQIEANMSGEPPSAPIDWLDAIQAYDFPGRQATESAVFSSIVRRLRHTRPNRSQGHRAEWLRGYQPTVTCGVETRDDKIAIDLYADGTHKTFSAEQVPLVVETIQEILRRPVA